MCTYFCGQNLKKFSMSTPICLSLFQMGRNRGAYTYWKNIWFGSTTGRRERENGSYLSVGASCHSYATVSMRLASEVCHDTGSMKMFRSHNVQLTTTQQWFHGRRLTTTHTLQYVYVSVVSWFVGTFSLCYPSLVNFILFYSYICGKQNKTTR